MLVLSAFGTECHPGSPTRLPSRNGRSPRPQESRKQPPRTQGERGGEVFYRSKSPSAPHGCPVTCVITEKAVGTGPSAEERVRRAKRFWNRGLCPEGGAGSAWVESRPESTPDLLLHDEKTLGGRPPHIRGSRVEGTGVHGVGRLRPSMRGGQDACDHKTEVVPGWRSGAHGPQQKPVFTWAFSASSRKLRDHHDPRARQVSWPHSARRRRNGPVLIR